MALTAAAVSSRGDPADLRSWSAARDSGSLAGENGLVVWRTGDSVTVGWLTDGAVPGMLEAFSNGQSVYRTTTPADSAHRASFEAPANRPLRLVYGGEGPADTHETVIRPDPGDDEPRVAWPAEDSIVVISDIHGEFDRMTAVLRNAGIVDENLQWAGGRRHLVVDGDIFDRGPGVTRALWFLYELEPQAQAAGGGLHLVLGNHELMIMLGDLRYLAPHDSTVARLHGTTFDRLYHPARSVIGRWLVSHPGLIRIGDVLFAHGGVSTEYAGWNLEEWRDTLYSYTHEELFNRWTDSTYVAPMDSAAFDRRWQFMWGERSVFWYRGYARADTLGAALDTILASFDAKVHVIGHTPDTTIRQKYDGKLILVNTVPFAAEALLLVRSPHGWNRYRIREEGPPEPLEPPAT